MSADDYGRYVGWVAPAILDQSSNDKGSDVGVAPPGKTDNLICSHLDQHTMLDKEQRWHRPVLDIDFEARLIPSSTPGHYHLYLDGALVEHSKYQYLLTVLASAGIISDGYLGHSLERGYTAVRAPGSYKPNGDEPYEPKHMKNHPKPKSTVMSLEQAMHNNDQHPPDCPFCDNFG